MSLLVRIACLLLLLAAPTHAIAQPVIRGTVTDGATGAPLPSATVQVDGTYRGTITNRDGRFSLRVDSLPVDLQIRFIGYQTARTTVSDATPPVQVTLQPSAVQMDELVVTGEDVAENIMQKVIDRKQAWWDSLDTYRVEAYNRLTVSNDTGIVSIIESQTTAFWDRERGTREVVRAQRKTANLGIDGALPAAQAITNLYDDNIEIGGHELIGVTHPDAVDRYDFTLDSTRVLDGTRVYDIRVEPTSRLASAFTGRVAVLDSAYALLEADLKPGRSFLFPPPVRGFDVRMQQQFSDFGGRFWLPVDFRTQFQLDVAFGPLLAFPTIQVRQAARLSDYRVNVPLPDTLFESTDTVIEDSARAALAGVEPLPVDSVGQDGAAIPLSASEEAAYASIDSTQTLEKAFAPSGVLSRFVDLSDDDDSASVSVGGGTDSTGGGWAWDLSFAPDVAYSRVEEGHLGGRTTLDLGERVSLTGGLAFNTGAAAPWRWAYGGSGRVVLGAEENAALRASYRYGIAPRFRSALYPRVFASLHAITSGDDYLDYAGTERAELRFRRQFPDADVRLELGVTDERLRPVATTTDFALFGSDAAFRPNPAVPAARLRTVEAELSWGDAIPLLLAFAEKEQLTMRVEHSAPTLLGSDADFTRVAADAQMRISTFFQRRLLPNALDVRFVGQAARGTLPVARLGIADASLSPLAPFGGLRTRTGRPYQGEHVAAAFWEHTFRTVPFEILRLHPLAQRGWSLIVHGGHVRTWMTDAQRTAWTSVGATPPDTDGWHHEVGVGLSGLFGLLRVDVAKRLDASGWGMGIGVARLF